MPVLPLDLMTVFTCPQGLPGCSLVLPALSWVWTSLAGKGAELAWLVLGQLVGTGNSQGMSVTIPDVLPASGLHILYLI